MARAIYGMLLCSIMAAGSVLISLADMETQKLDTEALQTQIKSLDEQVEDADLGKLETEKLMEEGKAKQLGFQSEITALKEALAAKNTKESTLHSQLTLLQEEMKRLQEEGALYQDLRGKFLASKRELGTTKDTLAKTLSQLADRSSSASDTEQRVAVATRKLQAAVQERDEVKSKLSALESHSQDASKVQTQLEKERAHSAKLQGEIEKLEEEKKSLNEELVNSKKMAKEAEKELAIWQSKAEKAESNVKRAEKTLEKALQDHSATQSALIQAEAKAEEAVKRMENLLTSWLPHWLMDRYQQALLAVEPALKHVRPAASKAWLEASKLVAQGRIQAMHGYAYTKRTSERAWRDAKPRIDSAVKGITEQTHLYTQKASKAAGPRFEESRQWLAKTYRSYYNHAASFLAQNRTVMRVRRSTKQTLRELESLAIKYLKQVPFLKDYARRPTVTYFVYAVLAAPLITIILPLLTLKGEQPRSSQKSNSRQSAALSDSASEKAPKNGKPKKTRRISVGDEHVRVP